MKERDRGLYGQKNLGFNLGSTFQMCDNEQVTNFSEPSSPHL